MKAYKFLVCWVALAALLISCAPQHSQQILLYYYDPELDRDASGNIQCTNAGLVPVQRKLPISLFGEALIEETIRLLIAGELTAEERGQGITTEFPIEDLVLTGATLIGGELTLSFEDPGFRTSGGACRAAILWAQIEATALQFPGVEQVRFSPEDLFQP